MNIPEKWSNNFDGEPLFSLGKEEEPETLKPVPELEPLNYKDYMPKPPKYSNPYADIYTEVTDEELEILEQQILEEQAKQEEQLRKEQSKKEWMEIVMGFLSIFKFVGTVVIYFLVAIFTVAASVTKGR
jgi:hypothetical protein